MITNVRACWMNARRSMKWGSLNASWMSGGKLLKICGISTGLSFSSHTERQNYNLFKRYIKYYPIGHKGSPFDAPCLLLFKHTWHVMHASSPNSIANTIIKQKNEWIWHPLLINSENIMFVEIFFDVLRHPWSCLFFIVFMLVDRVLSKYSTSTSAKWMRANLDVVPDCLQE